MHAITAIEPVPAEREGALDGFGARCTCGSLITASLNVIARQWGDQHVKYYNAKEGSC